MAAPGNNGSDGSRTLREHAERIVLAALGAFSLSADRIEELADELADRAGVQRDVAVELIREVVDGWRREAGRIGERTTDAAQRVVRDLGLVTHEELEDLELRLAQVEHRLKLLERAPQ
jgi:polyhydroxyalkanoate synthesis regulator phasin